MRKTSIAISLAFASLLIPCSAAEAQNAVLSQLFGNGVHAFYAGDTTAARDYFTMAISNGSTDPRVYYFRGIVAHSLGDTFVAESDWREGARLEAMGRSNPWVGRSLIRFQGPARLSLERIRQQAQLQAMRAEEARSNRRYRELDNSAIPDRVINPPPAPPAADAENPFADNMAEGDADVTTEDALEGSMDEPFADEPATPGDADGPADDGGGSPFDAGAAPDAPDPFGGSDDLDPFAE